MKESVDDNDICVIEVFREVDRLIECGELPIEKPWLQLPHPCISLTLPDDMATVSYLRSIVSMLWSATATKCGAPGGCCFEGRGLMVFCVKCREWLHLTCVNDMRRRPKKKEPYTCPSHAISKKIRTFPVF